MVAFGDNFVDLELLQYAGMGVAMGNAPQEVRQAVGRATASNDEEGVYIALRHLRFRAPKQAGILRISGPDHHVDVGDGD